MSSAPSLSVRLSDYLRKSRRSTYTYLSSELDLRRGAVRLLTKTRSLGVGSPDALLSRLTAQPVQRLRRQRLLRARAAAQPVQGVRLQWHLRARAGAQPVQGLRR